MKRIILMVFVLCSAAIASNCKADQVEVTQGVSSIQLDPFALGVAGLTISSYSNDVLVPSPRGATWVGFNVNGRDHAIRPTTFVYEVGTLLPASGTIEHSGSVFFNNDTIQFGDLSIGFDAARQNAINSGFYIASTTGAPIVLFDFQAVAGYVPDARVDGATFEAPILASPELAALLVNPLISGAPVGGFNFTVGTAVPEPTGCGLLLFVGVAFGMKRKRAI